MVAGAASARWRHIDKCTRVRTNCLHAHCWWISPMMPATATASGGWGSLRVKFQQQLQCRSANVEVSKLL